MRTKTSSSKKADKAAKAVKTAKTAKAVLKKRAGTAKREPKTVARGRQSNFLTVPANMPLDTIGTQDTLTSMGLSKTLYFGAYKDLITRIGDLPKPNRLTFIEELEKSMLFSPIERRIIASIFVGYLDSMVNLPFEFNIYGDHMKLWTRWSLRIESFCSDVCDTVSAWKTAVVRRIRTIFTKDRY